MDIAISALIFIIVTFGLTFALFDVQKNLEVKQILYENTRAASQNGLIEFSEQTDKDKVLTSMQMVERWLANFVNTSMEDFESITIGFVKIKSEPPLYLVRVEGKAGAYAFISADVYAEYISGTTIVAD